MKSDINTNVRLFDLVRFMRSELHEAELITDEEYAWLCMGCAMAKGQGSPSPRRLEDYDEIRDRMNRMELALAAVSTVGVLDPFIAVAKGIPGNWPGECVLSIDASEDGGLNLSYHPLHTAVGGVTIAQWRALVAGATKTGTDTIPAEAPTPDEQS